MHSSATRLRLISRFIVIALVIIVGIIVIIHDHVTGSGGHTATPTHTPASSGALRTTFAELRSGASQIVFIRAAAPHRGTWTNRGVGGFPFATI